MSCFEERAALLDCILSLKFPRRVGAQSQPQPEGGFRREESAGVQRGFDRHGFIAESQEVFLPSFTGMDILAVG